MVVLFRFPDTHRMMMVVTKWRPIICEAASSRSTTTTTTTWMATATCVM
jgi:hypothetical protein